MLFGAAKILVLSKFFPPAPSFGRLWMWILYSLLIAQVRVKCITAARGISTGSALVSVLMTTLAEYSAVITSTAAQIRQ